MHDKLPGLKLFKPENTELVHRVFSPSPQQFVMSFGVMVPFALNPPDQTGSPDISSLWELISGVLDKEQTLDESWPKPCAEFLAAGHCYYPPDHHDQPISATISVGTLTKRLAVFGDRHFTATGGISRPQPFTRIPITPAHAFGGATYAGNPIGKGIDTTDGQRQLPNIEHPNQLFFSPQDRPQSAGFGPLSSALPERARYLGPHTAQWQKERWPHLPEQTDARYFLAASEDQHLQGFWQGGEPVSVHNMHPQFGLLEGRVPSLRPRFFVHQSFDDGDARFRELNAQADTVWLLPDAQVGLVIYRAGIQVANGTGQDINAFYAELEDAATEPNPLDFYLGNCLRLMAPELFKDLPDPTSPEYRDELAGMDEAQLIQKLREQRSYFETSLKNSGMREDELLRQLEANPHTRQFAQTIAQRHQSLGGFFNEIEGLLKIIQNPDSAAAALSMVSAKPSLNQALTPYPQPAPQAPLEPRLASELIHDAAAAARQRQLVINAIHNGQSCAQLDLTHANLAGLDLAGHDFSGSILAGANFAGAQLQGACLDNIFASQARFDAAEMAGCSLRQASLNQASFVGAQLRGADLEQSNCSEANFSGADLSGCNLQSSILTLAWLQNIRAERLMADRAQLDRANLDGAWLPGARLAEANLGGARAQHANLQNCLAPKINLAQADLSGANLQNATLTGCQAGPGTSLVNARLDAALLENSTWAGADLTNASMSGIQAQNADFSDANLETAKATRSDLRGCNFDRANLRHATLTLSNLMQASFINANLGAGNFSQTNLYNATFVDTEIAAAQFTDANLDRTALAP